MPSLASTSQPNRGRPAAFVFSFGSQPLNLDARQAAILVEVAAEHEVGTATQHAFGRHLAAQQILAEHPRAAIRKGNRVLAHDVGKDAVAHGDHVLGKKAARDPANLSHKPKLHKGVRHDLGADGKDAAHEPRRVGVGKKRLDLTSQLIDLLVRAVEVADRVVEAAFVEIRVEGAGNVGVRVGVGVARKQQDLLCAGAPGSRFAACSAMRLPASEQPATVAPSLPVCGQSPSTSTTETPSLEILV